jgi:hypothetical protein
MIDAILCRHLILGLQREKNLENLKLKLIAQKEKDGPDMGFNTIVISIVV